MTGIYGGKLLRQKSADESVLIVTGDPPSFRRIALFGQIQRSGVILGKKHHPPLPKPRIHFPEIRSHILHGKLCHLCHGTEFLRPLQKSVSAVTAAPAVSVRHHKTAVILSRSADALGKLTGGFPVIPGYGKDPLCPPVQQDHFAEIFSVSLQVGVILIGGSADKHRIIPCKDHGPQDLADLPRMILHIYKFRRLFLLRIPKYTVKLRHKIGVLGIEPRRQHQNGKTLCFQRVKGSLRLTDTVPQFQRSFRHTADSSLTDVKIGGFSAENIGHGGFGASRTLRHIIHNDFLVFHLVTSVYSLPGKTQTT